MKYFLENSSPENIKIMYRKLAFMNHPDHGGDTATMQEINAEYLMALQHVNGYKSFDDQGKEHTYKYNDATEKAIMNTIDKLLKAKLTDVNINLIGIWIWITGETKKHKEVLKDIGCRYHAKRYCWYWKPAGHKAFKYSNASLASLANKYGCKKFGYVDGNIAKA